jgi:hypothetical protein
MFMGDLWVIYGQRADLPWRYCVDEEFDEMTRRSGGYQKVRPIATGRKRVVICGEFEAVK